MFCIIPSAGGAAALWVDSAAASFCIAPFDPVVTLSSSSPCSNPTLSSRLLRIASQPATLALVLSLERPSFRVLVVVASSSASPRPPGPAPVAQPSPLLHTLPLKELHPVSKPFLDSASGHARTDLPRTRLREGKCSLAQYRLCSCRCSRPSWPAPRTSRSSPLPSLPGLPRTLLLLANDSLLTELVFCFSVAVFRWVSFEWLVCDLWFHLSSCWLPPSHLPCPSCRTNLPHLQQGGKQRHLALRNLVLRQRRSHHRSRTFSPVFFACRTRGGFVLLIARAFTRRFGDHLSIRALRTL